jgi:hypothetical protein
MKQFPPCLRLLPMPSLRSGVVARRFAHEKPACSAPRCHSGLDARIRDAIDRAIPDPSPSKIDLLSVRSCASLRNYEDANLRAEAIPGPQPNLDWPERQRAYYWLGAFCRRWGRNLPRWRFARLVAQAHRLAKNPPTSAWCRSMLARRGGKAIQWKYRHEGRNPTEVATQAHAPGRRGPQASRFASPCASWFHFVKRALAEQADDPPRPTQAELVL